LRGAILIVMFAVAFRLMHDVGFTPDRGGPPLAEMRKIAANSIDYGWRVPAVKWLIVEALFRGGAGIYAFYDLHRSLFRRRPAYLLVTGGLSVIALALIGAIQSFWVVIGLTTVWGLLFAATMPIRQTYINGMIPSRQRATILSFDSMMSSTGGVWAQPVLGRVADASGYAASYLVSAGITAFAL